MPDVIRLLMQFIPILLLQLMAGYGDESSAASPTHPTSNRTHRSNFAPVSVWRTVFAANEWSELQVIHFSPNNSFCFCSESLMYCLRSVLHEYVLVFHMSILTPLYRFDWWKGILVGLFAIMRLIPSRNSVVFHDVTLDVPAGAVSNKLHIYHPIATGSARWCWPAVFGNTTAKGHNSWSR